VADYPPDPACSPSETSSGPIWHKPPREMSQAHALNAAGDRFTSTRVRAIQGHASRRTPAHSIPPPFGCPVGRYGAAPSSFASATSAPKAAPQSAPTASSLPINRPSSPPAADRIARALTALCYSPRTSHSFPPIRAGCPGGCGLVRAGQPQRSRCRRPASPRQGRAPCDRATPATYARRPDLASVSHDRMGPLEKARVWKNLTRVPRRCYNRPRRQAAAHRHE